MTDTQNSPIKISVIVPVYNVEKYIQQCLESLTNQTLRDIEIIFIDDASPDASSEAIELEAKKDNRISLIRNHTNEGVGASRNTGIAAATGKYLKIIDSDDFLASDALEVLYNEAEHHQADIVFHDAYSFWSPSNMKSYHYIDRHKPLNLMCGHAAWWYLFRRDIVAENYNIRFPEGCHPHEDTTFSFFLITYCKNHRYLQRELIYYRQHENMIMNNIFGSKRVQSERSAATCAIALSEFFKNLPSVTKIKRYKSFNELLVHFINSTGSLRELPFRLAVRVTMKKLQFFVFRSKITQSNHYLVKVFKVPVYRKSL
jgi:glycosyltransferase involved in cell wall biosynthesis